MNDRPKLSIHDLPKAITSAQRPAEMTDHELRDSIGAFSLLVTLAQTSQDQLTAQRYTLIAAGDQLAARQRDLDRDAHPSRCNDAHAIARQLSALHDDLAAHLEQWETLASNQGSLTAVLNTASTRCSELGDELSRRTAR